MKDTHKHPESGKAHPKADKTAAHPSAPASLPAMATAEQILGLQRVVGNRAVLRILQPKLKSGQPGNADEQQADRVAEEVVGRGEPSGFQLSPAAPLIQRFPDGDAAPAPLPAASAAREQSPDAASSPAAPAAERAEVSTADGPLLVEDEAAQLAPGQMRKADFLAELRAAVCSAADEALASAGRDTRGCPYVERGFDTYARRPASYIERALRKYAPEAAGAIAARDYIPAVSARVRRGVEEWAVTGQVTGVPEELAGMVSGGGLLGGVSALGAMIGGAVSGVVSGIGSAVSGLVGAVGGALSGIGRALFKRKEGGAGAADEPERVRGELSGGQPLDGGLRSRMGAAFGHDFSGVRVHADAHAAGLSDRLGARAFTVGSDIAFGAGEYQPGTLVGDALIAHELAHVVQQGGGAGGAGDGALMQKGGGGSVSLEEEADVAAVGAVLRMSGAVSGELAGLSTMPRLRSGLKLQRCGRCGGSGRYDWADSKLKKMIDKRESADAIRGYLDRLSPDARGRAIHDLERGRVDYRRHLDTIPSDELEHLRTEDAVALIDQLLTAHYRDVAKTQMPGVPAPETEYTRATTPAKLLAGTREVKPDERKAIGEALTPSVEVDPETGEEPKFKDCIGGVCYEPRLKAQVNLVVTSQFDRLASGKGALHADKSNLYPEPDVAAVANEAKTQTDQVFGSYARRPAFVFGTNLIDRWEQQEGKIAGMTPDQKHEVALQRVEKILSHTDSVLAIHREHGVVRRDSRKEVEIIDRVREEIAAAREEELLEIHKGWPGSQDPATGRVFLQLFKQGTPTEDKPDTPMDESKTREDREFMWRTFQMLIHEYIHALAHSEYRAYARSLSKEQRDTLVEGMADALTKIVWSNVNLEDKELRKRVERGFNDPEVTHRVPDLHVYASTPNAEEVLGIVGIQNAYAAYFLGRVELIGKP